MSACARSYGVAMSKPFSGIEHDSKDLAIDPLTRTQIAEGQLLWLIKKGDLILSDQPKETRSTFNMNFTEEGLRTGAIPIYVYDDDFLPDRLADSREGLLFHSILGVIFKKFELTRLELHLLHNIHYDLKDIPLQEFPRSVNVNSRSSYLHTATLTLTMRLEPGVLNIYLHFGERLIYNYTTNIPESL